MYTVNTLETLMMYIKCIPQRLRWLMKIHFHFNIQKMYTKCLFMDLKNVYNCKIYYTDIQSTHDNRLKLSGEIEKGSSYRKFELSRFTLYRKWPEGKWKLLRVSGRFELARVPVTVEPRFNDLRYNDIPGITINIRLPSKSCSKMYWEEHRYNDFW